MERKASAGYSSLDPRAYLVIVFGLRRCAAEAFSTLSI
jgi:hypothetical protein